MKSVFLVIVGLLVITAGVCKAAEFLPVDTIDTQKLNAIAPGSWINNAFWPVEATMRARAYAGDIACEKADLSKVLQRVMRKECLPPENLVQAEAVGIANLRRGGDYLLLHYKTSTGLDIRVTDERSLCLMITFPERTRKPLSEVGPFVWRTAASVLKFPEFDGKGPQEPEIKIAVSGPHVRTPLAERPPYVPSVVVLTGDFGRSKSGNIEYGPMSLTGDGWYSRFGWWSDGQRVMFNLSKLTEEDYVALKTVALLQPIPPRVFKSRMLK